MGELKIPRFAVAVSYNLVLFYFYFYFILIFLLSLAVPSSSRPRLRWHWRLCVDREIMAGRPFQCQGNQGGHGSSVSKVRVVQEQGLVGWGTCISFSSERCAHSRRYIQTSKKRYNEVNSSLPYQTDSAFPSSCVRGCRWGVWSRFSLK